MTVLNAVMVCAIATLAKVTIEGTNGAIIQQNNGGYMYGQTVSLWLALDHADINNLTEVQVFVPGLPSYTKAEWIKGAKAQLRQAINKAK